jgi:nucleotidyltransferase/DNA polymerase involved in DNA repair
MRGRSLIVGGDELRRGRVVDATEDCLAAGVSIGMTVREASELAPNAALLPANPVAVADLLERVIEHLDRFSQAIEAGSEGARDGGAWLIPATSIRTVADERRLGAALVDSLAAGLGLETRVGFGPGKAIARIAASRAVVGGVEVVADDAAASYLAALPVALLPLLPGAVERLKLLGVATIGDFARLPPESLPRRFGREAVLAARIARGADDTPLVSRPRPESLTMRRAFEPPIENRSILLLAARDLLERLCRQLQASQRTFRALTLTAGLEDGRLADRRSDLREPTNEAQRCRSLLQSMVETFDLRQAISFLALRLSVLAREAPRQESLFDGMGTSGAGPSDRRVRVDRAMAEINRRYRGHVRRITPGDDPQSLLDDRRLWLVPSDSTSSSSALPVNGEGAKTPSPFTGRAEEGGSPRDGARGEQRQPRFIESALRLRPIHLIARQGRLYLVEPNRPPDWPRDEIIALHARWEADDWWPEAARRTYYRVHTRRGQIVTLARDHAHQRWLVVEAFE